VTVEPKNPNVSTLPQGNAWPTTEPEAVGLSTDRLDRIAQHLEARYLAPGKIPGCLTVVARRGEVAYCRAQGSMDSERQKPMREDTLFRIYSMTKPITSVALMSLFEEGHFALGDRVDRFIPEWRDLRVFEAGVYPHFRTSPALQPMTIRDLLTHTSGLTYDFMYQNNVDAAYRKLGIGRNGTLRSMVEELATLPLLFSPGSAWNYSVSTDVCGYLCEVISGKPFDAFLQERIFDRLGMTETGFRVPADRQGRFAACYERRRDKSLRLQDDPEKSPYLEDRSFKSGGGGLVSTAADYLRFCEMLHGGGVRAGSAESDRVIGPRTLALMTQNHLPGGRDLTGVARGNFSESPYEGVGFGLGFSVQLDPVRSQNLGTMGEFAWGGAASTVFWVDPVEELTVLFFTQFMPSATFNFRGQLKQLVYSSIID
jgi:CubicO group peptidase (beta-lactamase class C family)